MFVGGEGRLVILHGRQKGDLQFALGLRVSKQFPLRGGRAGWQAPTGTQPGQQGAGPRAAAVVDNVGFRGARRGIQPRRGGLR